ncbi:MAG: hypothetical protein WC840_04025 [Candidatus Peribacteraceae bacterium]
MQKKFAVLTVIMMLVVAGYLIKQRVGVGGNREGQIAPPYGSPYSPGNYNSPNGFNPQQNPGTQTPNAGNTPLSSSFSAPPCNNHTVIKPVGWTGRNKNSAIRGANAMCNMMKKTTTSECQVDDDGMEQFHCFAKSVGGGSPVTGGVAKEKNGLWTYTANCKLIFHCQA